MPAGRGRPRFARLGCGTPPPTPRLPRKGWARQTPPPPAWRPAEPALPFRGRGSGAAWRHSWEAAAGGARGGCWRQRRGGTVGASRARRRRWAGGGARRRGCGCSASCGTVSPGVGRAGASAREGAAGREGPGSRLSRAAPKTRPGRRQPAVGAPRPPRVSVPEQRSQRGGGAACPALAGPPRRRRASAEGKEKRRPKCDAPPSAVPLCDEGGLGRKGRAALPGAGGQPRTGRRGWSGFARPGSRWTFCSVPRVAFAIYCIYNVQ